MSRQGGKLKPLKAPKKEQKEEDENDKAFKDKKKADEAAVKAAKDKGAFDLVSYVLRSTISLITSPIREL
ncbi:hypothetical protein PAXINDRAFT_9958 [Paxillus involutus ATCC 200175]|nr:hypothetical protein PAXINDRAFT_9958 [Paxillus involutus ATCC 200175]